MKILKSKEIVKAISKELKQKISQNDYKPRLVIFQIGEEPASNKYVEFKLKKAKELGVVAVRKQFGEAYPQEKLIEDMKEIMPWIDGMIVQLPLPDSYDIKKVMDTIPFIKDIDGLASGNDLITPATPRGIMSLMKAYGIKLNNKIIGVIGQSNLVGSPIAKLCEKDSKKVIRFDKETSIKGSEQVDILIVAAGKVNLVKRDNVKKNAIIIDVGINAFGNNQITGDVDRVSLGEKASAITPIIGGVGPMTVISLFQNLIDATYKK
ncbi:MAG: bifunctional 5,10-methylenetetrahydrofolate dehydrogenase/5,10-methenyltetrahydrofolate cyclohydrolase [Mycoplasmataceae bacterium]|nr:bifunctional 5,10-methylenetetrahydrofolate dehydrogenase/5,10-methenyltetrahydrofolate cyclohydrolase [Mycoplasmataceae bacterium]